MKAGEFLCHVLIGIYTVSLAQSQSSRGQLNWQGTPTASRKPQLSDPYSNYLDVLRNSLVSNVNHAYPKHVIPNRAPEWNNYGDQNYLTTLYSPEFTTALENSYRHFQEKMDELEACLQPPCLDPPDLTESLVNTYIALKYEAAEKWEDVMRGIVPPPHQISLLDYMVMKLYADRYKKLYADAARPVLQDGFDAIVPLVDSIPLSSQDLLLYDETPPSWESTPHMSSHTDPSTGFPSPPLSQHTPLWYQAPPLGHSEPLSTPYDRPPWHFTPPLTHFTPPSRHPKQPNHQNTPLRNPASHLWNFHPSLSDPTPPLSYQNSPMTFEAPPFWDFTPPLNYLTPPQHKHGYPTRFPWATTTPSRESVPYLKRPKHKHIHHTQPSWNATKPKKPIRQYTPPLREPSPPVGDSTLLHLLNSISPLDDSTPPLNDPIPPLRRPKHKHTHHTQSAWNANTPLRELVPSFKRPETPIRQHTPRLGESSPPSRDPIPPVDDSIPLRHSDLPMRYEDPHLREPTWPLSGGGNLYLSDSNDRHDHSDQPNSEVHHSTLSKPTRKPKHHDRIPRMLDSKEMTK